MIVRKIEPDGTLSVTNLGGLYPWKLGEGPVDILATAGTLPGVLGFGSIHTNDPGSRAQRGREKPLDWSMADVFTGLPAEELMSAGVRPGTRVVVSRSRRSLVRLGHHLAGYFLDDRADLVSWLLALDKLGDADGVLFAATTAEEVGCEGAQYLLNRVQPEVCIALELGPYVPDAPSDLSDAPSVWVSDSFAVPATKDLDLLAELSEELGIPLQFQAFSRGGSDASASASRGLCARPFTLGLPMENSHGFEIMHEDAMTTLAELTVALVKRLE
jgi:putative aminopeptidase FrvX